jgi:hypothetical protein
MTASEVQEIINDVPCDLCNSPPGLAWYLVLAAFLDLANGDPVPETTQALITEANCLICMVPPGLVPYLLIQAARNISTGGSGTSCCFTGNGAPAAALGAPGNVYWDELNRDFYVKRADDSTWELLIDLL